MALLFDSDYRYLADNSLEYVEDEDARFLIFRNFPLPKGLYVGDGTLRESVDVLYVIPPNYNTEGGDMFWVRPMLARANAQPIPNVNGPGEDSRTHDDAEYFRWSRHWNNRPWKPKVDNVQTIYDRITWALAHPDATR